MDLNQSSPPPDEHCWGGKRPGYGDALRGLGTVLTTKLHGSGPVASSSVPHRGLGRLREVTKVSYQDTTGVSPALAHFLP